MASAQSVAQAIWRRVAGQPGADLFPEEFDADFYRSFHADLRHMSAAEASDHFQQFGLTEGRPGSPAALHDNYLKLIPTDKPILEIGPFFKPLVTGRMVKYFDILDTEALRQRAKELGGDPEACPNIDYVSSNGDLSSIPETFHAVFSSHCIEHQPDFIRHLTMVANLLEDGGHYFLLIPDQRFCFDHFLSPSTIADVLDAHLRGRIMSEPRNRLQYRLLRTHNDPSRHWAGDHGQTVLDGNPAELVPAIEEASRYRDDYIDTHNWQFTPESFRSIMSLIRTLGLSPLETVRIYNCVRGTAEFGAILRKPPAGSVAEHTAPPD